MRLGLPWIVALAAQALTLPHAGGADADRAGVVHVNPRPGPVDAAYFGLHIHRATTGSPWPDVPFGAWRLWDARVSWPHLQPAPDRWDFRTLDAYVALAAEQGVDLLLPLGLSPAWASARPQEPSAYAPGWAAEPARIEDWEAYVQTVASRYRGRIRYYEVWNEPNLKRFFSGEPRKMDELACAARRAVKRVDPGAQIVSPAATAKDEGVAWLDGHLARGAGECADIVGFHFYLWAHEPPELLPELVAKVRNVMQRHGVSAKPLWNTEAGWYFANARVANPTPHRVVPPAEMPGYVVRALALGAAAGLDRYYWYAWDNRFMGGLIEPDTLAPKPAATGFAQAVRWLRGTRVESCERSAAGVYVCTLSAAGARRSWLVWHPSRTQRWTPPAAWNANHYVTVLGAKHALGRGDDGTLEIGPTPVLMRSSAS
jgi:hypothetical protein